MSSSSMHPSAQPVGPDRHHGFPLVEIMVAVVLIGMLAALAIPAFQRAQRASRNARVISDLRVFSQTFEIFNTQNGSWPDGAAPRGDAHAACLHRRHVGKR